AASGEIYVVNSSTNQERVRRIDCFAPPTPTFSPTWTRTPTPTPSATPCDLNVTGTVTLNAGSYSYCNVHVFAGGTLNSNGVVTLTIVGDFTVDATGQVRG